MAAPTPELIDALYMDKIRTAESMTDEQLLASGVELFEIACRITKGGDPRATS